MTLRWALLPLLLASCGDYPRDTAGTLDRVRGETLRIGWSGERDDPHLRRFVQELGRRTASRPVLIAGAGEPLLRRLERGELDLVLGTFDKKTPWSHRVTFSKPIAAVGDEERKAASHNGEHAWAMEVDRAVAATGAAR